MFVRDEQDVPEEEVWEVDEEWCMYEAALAVRVVA